MPAKYTIEFNSGGNHGHQLKDYLGGRAIGEVFNMEYISTPNKYLKKFGIEKNKTKYAKWKRNIFFKKIIYLKGPYWDGFEKYDDFLKRFGEIINPNEDSTLYIFEYALRLHPCQTIAWKNKNKISKDIFSIIQKQTTADYLSLNSKPAVDSPQITVALHINRGQDFDKVKFPDHFESSYNVRYMFPMAYYQNICTQIQSNYGIENVVINIFTEEFNSEEITTTFHNSPGIKIHIGSNRTKNNEKLVAQIFQSFVESDILVCSNSSFSSVASYFRWQKTTIYHPHKHLHNLPSPYFISTSEDGFFNTLDLPSKLSKYIVT